MYSGRLEYICWNLFYPPRCIDALFRVRIPFQSLVQRLIQIPVRQSKVQSMFTARLTYIYLSYDYTRNAWSFYILHLALFRLVGLRNERLLNLFSLLLQHFLLLLCLHVHSWNALTVTAKAKISFPSINMVLTRFFWSLSMLYWTNNKGVPKPEILQPKIANKI